MKYKQSYKTRIRGKEPSSQNKILRFRKSERHVHWAIALPFMLCFTSALILVFFYNPNPSRPYREVFSWIHRISGVCLFFLPIWAMIKSRGDYRMYFYNIKQAWVWTLEDIKWLFMMGLATVNKKIKLPEQGKFNAAEKINFMTLMSTYPLYILTGILIWLTDGAFLSWVIHFAMALLATPLMFGHIFMATVNPDTRTGLSGMISGFVDRQWAKHHYTRWYRETFENEGVFWDSRTDTIAADTLHSNLYSEPAYHGKAFKNPEPNSGSEDDGDVDESTDTVRSELYSVPEYHVKVFKKPESNIGSERDGDTDKSEDTLLSSLYSEPDYHVKVFKNPESNSGSEHDGDINKKVVARSLEFK